MHTTRSNMPDAPRFFVRALGRTAAAMLLAAGMLGFTAAPVFAQAAWAWGDNMFGQLGNGTNTHSNVPVPVTGMSSGVTAITGGGAHSLAIQNGAAWAWGNNSFGSLGNGTNTHSNVPVPVTGMSSGVTAVVRGSNLSLAIQNGAAWAWGWNINGSLGNGTTDFSSNVPVPVPG